LVPQAVALASQVATARVAAEQAEARALLRAPLAFRTPVTPQH
jgi:hypothetical protein